MRGGRVTCEAGSPRDRPGTGPDAGSAVEDLRSADEALARLGRFEARARLRLGDRLDALFTNGGHHELGFSSERAYVLERCGQKERWALETRALARRLREKKLHRIRAAIWAGRLGFTMAQVLARHATPQNEAALLARAEGTTVREMKRHLAEALGSSLEEAEDEPAKVCLRRGVGPVEMLMVHASRPLVELITGSHVSDETLLTALLGEAESTLLAIEEKRSVSGVSSPEVPRHVEALAGPIAEHASEHADCVAPNAVVPGLNRIAVAPPPTDPLSLDAEIVRASMDLATRHLDMGRLAQGLLRSGWRVLGYSSPATYARERVGVSLSTLEHRATLWRRASVAPELRDALVLGDIGIESAMLIGLVLDRARSVDRDLVRAWVLRASRRTVIHLREEVNTVLVLSDLDRGASLFPPGDDELEEVAELERMAQSGAFFDTLLGSRYRAPQMFVTLRSGRGLELRLRVPEDVAHHFADVERRFKKLAPPGASFVAFLCIGLWQAWLPYVEAYKDKWKHIYLRDRHRCLNPTCDRHDVTPHHFWFRSRGGGHQEWNLGSLCFWCHIFGIHEGRLQAAPPANDIYWLIGRVPIMEVRGREMRRLSGHRRKVPRGRPAAA